MDQPTLRQVLRKKNEFLPLLEDLAARFQSSIRIEDGTGQVLWQRGEVVNEMELPVLFEGKTAGWVKGDKNAESVASLLGFLLKEDDKRMKMGREVLNLYREINLIFDFSDKIAKTIDARQISKIALEEAGHVIPFDYGAIIFREEGTGNLAVETKSENGFFPAEAIQGEFHLLAGIILNGQSDILADLSALKQSGIIPSPVSSLMYSALKVKHRIMGAFVLASDKEDNYTAASLKLLTTIALQSASAIESSLLFEKNIRESRESEEAMRRVLDVTAKFVPTQFIHSLGREVLTDIRLGDQIEKQVTVLFTDIRDYTTLSELMTPEETFGFICSLNERMGPIIRSHNGFINQYLGDSIMAIFPGNPADALHSAVGIQAEMAAFNLVREQKGQPPIRIGIGLHTGSLIMGITGDLERLDACTISDTVNTASRVENLTKHYHADILLSQASLEQIPNPALFRLRDLGMVQLKGKLRSIHIHECFDSNPGFRIRQKELTLPHFREAMDLFSEKSFERSREAFQQVLELDPADAVSRFFLAHTHRLISSGSLENNTGIVEMGEK